MGLLMIGPSRLGKTAWARSLGRHMFHSGLFSLDNWDEGAKYCVFDDIDWDYFPNKKQLLGSQYEFTITDKYRRKRTVKYGKPWIYCMNWDNYNKITNSELSGWIAKNSYTSFIDENIF